MTLIDSLIRRARKFWDKGQNIPIDLLYEMLGEGIDVATLERKHMKYN